MGLNVSFPTFTMHHRAAKVAAGVPVRTNRATNAVVGGPKMTKTENIEICDMKNGEFEVRRTVRQIQVVEKQQVTKIGFAEVAKLLSQTDKKHIKIVDK